MPFIIERKRISFEKCVHFIFHLKVSIGCTTFLWHFRIFSFSSKLCISTLNITIVLLASWIKYLIKAHSTFLLFVMMKYFQLRLSFFFSVFHCSMPNVVFIKYYFHNISNCTVTITHNFWMLLCWMFAVNLNERKNS